MAHLPAFWKAVYGVEGPPTAAQLVRFLADDTVPLDVRDDAAMDLSSHNDVEAEMALLWVASSPETPHEIHDTAGESLGEIWARRGGYTREKFRGLSPSARQEVRAVARSKGMTWDTADE